jgi:hypothetical protein
MHLAEEEYCMQEQEEKDHVELEEWAWACEEREDMYIEAEGFGFLLMDLLRIVALEREPGVVSTREPVDGHNDEGKAATNGSIKQLESPTAWENTVSLALLADICRSQLQGYRRYTIPGNATSDVPKRTTESVDGGGLTESANENVAGSNTRVVSARQAVEYERALLLRKLGEIERALQDTTAVRLHSNAVATAEATRAIRQRRAFTRRRQALRPAAMPD